MRGARYLVAAIAGVLLIASACGKRGALRPPEPKGPLAPKDVAARQRGPRVEVSFVVPAPRGPKPAQAPRTAELVRLEYAPGTPPPEAEAFRHARLVAVERGDPLGRGARLRLVDATWTALDGGGTGWTLRYAVRVRDGHDRSSPLVVAPDLVPIPPPAPPSGLRAEATAEGIRLRWEAPPGGPIRFNLYRTVGAEPPGEKPLNADPLSSTDYLDAAVTVGKTYRYEVRTAGYESLPYRESDPAGPIDVLAEDRFPPAAPTGLVAVQEANAVRLFWNPNGERDLAGYRVERHIGSGAFESLGPGILLEPFYLDGGVAAGTRATYRVVAADRAGNTGPPSDEVTIDVAADAGTGGAK